MKKLQLEADPGSSDLSDERYMTPQNLFKIENTINKLIDLVNSQQEAIEKLERVFETQTVPDIMLPATKKPYKIIEMNPSELSQLLDTEPADDKPDGLNGALADYKMKEIKKDLDTHRTFTLRIPKGKTIAEAVAWALFRFEKDEDITGPASISDTDLQKALDEVQPNE